MESREGPGDRSTAVVAADRQWLPSRGVLLHIGPPKTGTTALQTSLAAARSDLAEQGVLYPGGGRHTQHGHAAAAVLRRRRAGAPEVDSIDVWTRFARKVSRRSDRAFLSAELFADARDEHIERILADLGPSDVKVLITLRPLESLLASTWQQDIKGGRPQEFSQWLHERLDGRGAEDFWRRHAHDELVQRWVGALGPDRVAVLPVDSGNPAAILRDAERIAGIRPATLAEKRGNRSLSAAEAELLRRLFERLGRDFDPQLFQHWVRIGGFKALVENRVPGPEEDRIRTPAWAVRRARELHAPMLDRIEAGGVAYLADPAPLRPEGEVPDVVDLRDSGPDSVPLDAAVELLLGVYRAAERDYSGLQQQTQPGPDAPEVVPATRDAAAPGLWRRALRRARRHTAPSH